MKKNLHIIAASVCIALGITVLGICINSGLQSFSNKERAVAVRGLAQRDFTAISASLSIEVRCTSDFPNELIAKTEKAASDIVGCLRAVGYDSIAQSPLDLYDSKEYYEYDWDGEKRIKIKKDRYSATKNLSFTSTDVKKMEDLKNQINRDLISNNLSQVVNNIYTSYHFAPLNEIKPALIAESTQNARTAGEQFAKDSKSRLGKIKTASQGQIELSSSGYTQTARVVSTIVFFLED